MAMGSLNRPVFGRMGRLGFGHQYTTKMKVFMKKIRFLAKIGISITVFPFLRFLTILPLHLYFELIQPMFEFLEISIPYKIPYIFALKSHPNYKDIPIISGSNIHLTFLKLFGHIFSTIEIDILFLLTCLRIFELSIMY